MNALIRPLLILPVLLFACLGGRAHADWINLTGAETARNIAEIYIEADRVRLVLEIHIDSLRPFGDLVPDDWLAVADPGRPTLSERIHRFSTEVFRLVTDDGVTLPAELKLAEARLRKDRSSPFAGMINPTTGQRVPEAPKDKRVLYVEIDYPFAGQPESLTIMPPLDDENIAAADIGFIAYHGAVPIIDFRYLSAPAKVALDWDDPWYSKFDNPNLKRHHKSALMSFLYVEPREVRHEVLIRVRDLQDWTDLGLSGGSTIDPADRARIKQNAGEFFVAHNPLQMDGEAAKPASTRAEFLRISLNGLEVVGDDRPIDLSTAILGIILSYPTKQSPQHVTVQWDLFSERVVRFPATAIDPAGPFLSYIEADDPNFEWRNYLLEYEEPRVSPVVLDDGRSIAVPVLSILLLVIAFGATGLAFRQGKARRKLWAAIAGSATVAAVLVFPLYSIDVANPLAGPPDERVSAQILSAVLANVNHAYLEKDPATLRQNLEVVVAAEGLSDVETELGRALAIKVAGGGLARVNAIEDLVLKDIATLEGRRGFRSLAEWTAKASAGHWGHAHRRTIRFRALVELVEENGAWKLGGITVVDAKQQT